MLVGRAVEGEREKEAGCRLARCGVHAVARGRGACGGDVDAGVAPAADDGPSLEGVALRWHFDKGFGFIKPKEEGAEVGADAG